MRAVMVAALGLALAAPAVASANGFVEDVRVLQEWHGDAGRQLRVGGVRAARTSTTTV